MKRSFISYLCKMHRRYEGQNADIKKMFEYLKKINFKIKFTDDLKRVFRQLIMSWNLEPGANTEEIWEDYRSIIHDYDWFNLYTARDMKVNNMRHIMGKNDKNSNSFENLERFIIKYELNREEIELGWLKLGKFPNKDNKIPMIEEDN